MSISIKSKHAGSTKQVSVHNHGTWVGIDSTSSDGFVCLDVDTNELIEAIEKEVGGIFLKNADLPEVTPHPHHPKQDFLVDGNTFALTDEDTGYMERIAKTYLVAARHIRANQPVIDQEQVEAFNKALVEVEMDHPDGPVPYKVAQDLVKAGYKITKEV